MISQDIIDNAPEGATHFNERSQMYYKEDRDGFYYLVTSGVWGKSKAEHIDNELTALCGDHFYIVDSSGDCVAETKAGEAKAHGIAIEHAEHVPHERYNVCKVIATYAAKTTIEVERVK